MDYKLLKQFPWCKEYGLDNVEMNITEDAVTIYNSNKIKKLKHMKDVINIIYEYSHLTSVANRSMFSLLNEWRSHNFLFWMRYKTDQTKDCDLNNESLYRRIAYFFLSLFYIGQ